MSDYRNQDFNDPSLDDPLRRDAKMNPDARASNATWGWIAAAVFVVVVLAVAFGLGHQGNNTTNTASNDMMPSAVTHMAPPASMAPTASSMLPPAANPVPATPAPPLAPAPNAPAAGQ